MMMNDDDDETGKQWIDGKCTLTTFEARQEDKYSWALLDE